MNLKDHIRSVADYPKKGILFRDITTLIKNEIAFTNSGLTKLIILSASCRSNDSLVRRA